MTTLDPAVETFLGEQRPARLESYLEFLRIPSISALPAHAGDMQRAAQWIAGDLGPDPVVRLGHQDGQPALLADRLPEPYRQAVAAGVVVQGPDFGGSEFVA